MEWFFDKSRRFLTEHYGVVIHVGDMYLPSQGHAVSVFAQESNPYNLFTSGSNAMENANLHNLYRSYLNEDQSGIDGNKTFKEILRKGDESDYKKRKKMAQEGLWKNQTYENPVIYFKQICELAKNPVGTDSEIIIINASFDDVNEFQKWFFDNVKTVEDSLVGVCLYKRLHEVVNSHPDGKEVDFDTLYNENETIVNLKGKWDSIISNVVIRNDNSKTITNDNKGDLVNLTPLMGNSSVIMLAKQGLKSIRDWYPTQMVNVESEVFDGSREFMIPNFDSFPVICATGESIMFVNDKGEIWVKSVDNTKNLYGLVGTYNV